MRIDEHGRWVSDDGAYVWDEVAQVWQPTAQLNPGPASAPAPDPSGAPAGEIGGYGRVGETTGSWGWNGHDQTGQQPALGQQTGQQPALGQHSVTGEHGLPAQQGYGQGGWPAGDTGAYPAQQQAGGYPAQQHTGGYPAQQHTGGYPVQGGDTGGYPAQQHTGGYPVQGGDTGGYAAQQHTGGYPVQGGDTGGYPAQQHTGGWGTASTTGHDMSSAWPGQQSGQSGAGPANGAPDAPSTTGSWSPQQLPRGSSGWPGEADGTGPVATGAPTGATSAGVDPHTGEWGAQNPPAGYGSWQARQAATAEGGATAWGTPAPRGGGPNALSAHPFDDDPDESSEGRGGVMGRLSSPVLIGGAAALAILLVVVVVLVTRGGGKKHDNVAAAPPSATASSSASASPSKSTLPAKYQPQVEQAFISECLKTSVGKQAYCQCALTKFEAAFDQTKFLALNKNINSAQSRQIVTTVATQCLSKR